MKLGNKQMHPSEFKSKVEKLKNSDAMTSEQAAALGELADTYRSLENSLKRLELKFETVIEVTSQINAKSLNLELIENFTLNTVMGYFVCPQVFLMRRDNYMMEALIPSLAKNMPAPELSFEPSSPFAEKLIAFGRPLEIAKAAGEFGKFEEYKKLVKLKVEYVVPLIKQGNHHERSLQGILCMGKKFKGEGLTEEQMDFLELLGTMIAISLHNAQLYHRSIFDGLTQVYSRGHFDVHLAQEIERTKRYHTVRNLKDLLKSVSLIMLDIDDFKHFNDTYGHQAGDAILKTLARKIYTNCRASDVVARYGGEEFSVILTETDKQSAIVAAERLIAILRKEPIEFDGRQFTVTVSMGVSSFPTDCENMHDLILKADQALYMSKGKGKDMVSVAPPRENEQPGK
jgi:diguanylate cyclase (GGDEF)-like protein